MSFKVGQGEILGLLGSNGAGKPTIMNILTTQIVPTSGTASLEGFDILEEPIEVRKNTIYLPENVPLYIDMVVAEYLRFVAEGRGLQGPLLRERLDWVVEKCGISGDERKGPEPKLWADLKVPKAHQRYLVSR